MRPPTPVGVLRTWPCWPVLALWVALLVQTWQGGGSPHRQQLLLCGVTVGSALACWARVAVVRESRLLWALLALGLSGYGGGFVILFYVSMGEGGGPAGLNISDTVSLVLYPSVYAGLVVLTRSRVERWSRGALLDGVVVALAGWAVALAWIAAAFPSLLQGGAREVLYALAYPVGGFTLLAVTLTGLVVTRARPDGVWLLLVLAFAAWTAGDAVYAARSAMGAFAFGTTLDAVYTAGPLCVAFAAWTRARPVGRAARGSSAVMAVPALATLAALGVLIDRSRALPAVAVALAAGVVLAAVARAAVFVRQERLLAQRTLEALTDELTGLANRRGLLAHLAGRLESGAPGALLRIELNRFSQVNDALGHSAGDRLLQELGRRLQAALPELFVARLASASFGVLLAPEVGVDPAARAVLLAERLMPVLEVPIALDGCDVSVAGAAGISVWTDEGVGSGELLRRADVALHVAKQRATGPQVWCHRHDEGAREQLGLVADLTAALLATDQLFVHLQPKFEPHTRRMKGLEALVRWQHPTRGLVPPDAFIASAERAGLLPGLTDRVLELSLGHAADLRAAGHPLQIAINVGAPDLLDPTFAARVGEALVRHDVPSALLRIEVTETVVMSDPERIMRTLLLLRELGIGLSLDDYGTGLSSLTYLRQLPVDELKIDRSFVNQLISDPASDLIVGSTIALAHGLGMRVVAEGVEDEATLAALAAAGCDVVQGFLLGRPVAVDRLALRTEPLVPASVG